MVQPAVIDPEHIYDDGALVMLLGVTEAALGKGRAAGQLKFTRKGKRVFYLGSWVLDWLKIPNEPVAEGQS